MRGKAALRSRLPNRTRNAAAPSTQAIIGNETRGQTESWFNASTASSSDGISSKAPGQSNVSATTSAVRGRTSQPSTTATAEKGTATQNTHCQPSEASSSPPTTGPTLTPMACAAVKQPMAWARWSPGTDFTRMAMLLAPSRLPPMPCRARKAISVGRSCASPHIREAAPNRAKPAR